MVWCRSALREERRIVEQGLALLDLVGLSAVHDMPATSLPLVAQKRIEVCRALMARPRLLLLDEPAAGLDEPETAEFTALLGAACAAGITIVMVEHNMSLVMNAADEVIVIDLGRCIARGTPHQVQRDRRVINAYLGLECGAV